MNGLVMWSEWSVEREAGSGCWGVLGQAGDQGSAGCKRAEGLRHREKGKGSRL